MKMKTAILIEDLIERSRNVLNRVVTYQSMGQKDLNWKSDDKSWSVLECIEHLNRYGDFYIPEIDQRISKAEDTPVETFHSGILGNYFAKSMLPKEKLNKMGTFKSMNPAGSSLDKAVLDKFIDQQKLLLELLNAARTKNLTKVKTSISISKWIKLRLGDTFRVVIYHNQRHIVQADKVLTDFG